MRTPFRRLLLLATFSPLTALAAPAAHVNNGANEGPGSLRAALASGASQIVIDPAVSTIVVTETLEYAGQAPLRLLGHGQTIDGAALTDNAAPVFAVTQGADLSIQDLTIDAGGGNSSAPYSRDNPGGGKGIYVSVPLWRTGLVDVKLNRVTVLGTGNHGVHISDCTLGDDCGAGAGGGGDGSAASILLTLNRVLVEGNGRGRQDGDGVRVDERGNGEIALVTKNSVFTRNGGDGVELDEGNNGSVQAFVHNSSFIANGDYCFEADLVLFPECDDDGDPDVDDAFDIDEAGPGSLVAVVTKVDVIDNYDEGLDFDEDGTGAAKLFVTGLYSSGNEDEGIKVSELGAGNNLAWLYDVITDGDLEFEEEDGGRVGVNLFGSTVGDEMQIAADDDDPATVDGYYLERHSSVGDLDFEGDFRMR